MIPRSLLLLFVASAALAAELEDSEQKGYLEGSVTFSVAPRGDVPVCRFQPPDPADPALDALANVDNGAGCFEMCDSDPDARNGATWTYEFSGNKDTGCGITIRGLQEEDAGIWSYSTGADTGKIDLIIPLEPTEVFFVDSSGDRVDEDDDELEFEYRPSSVGQSVQLRCVVKPVRPEPEMTVRFQDGSFINVTFIEDSDDPYPFIDAGIAADGENAYKADFLYYPQPSDDGKILECVVEHETLTAGELPPAKYNVTVTAPPDKETASLSNAEDVEVGDDAELKVSLTCNPYAETLLWRGPGISSEGLSAFGEEEDPADQGVSGRASKGRFDAKYSRDGNRYTVTLTVEEVEEDDEGDRFTLTVENRLGAENFTVEIGELDDGGLSGGEIAGITIGCVAFVALVILLVFLAVRYKRKRSSREQQARMDRARAHYASQQEYEVRRAREDDEMRERQRAEGEDNRGADIPAEDRAKRGSVGSTEC